MQGLGYTLGSSYASDTILCQQEGDDDKIRDGLRLIFQPDVTQLVAWRTSRLKYSEDRKIFLSIVRKLRTEHMRSALIDRTYDANFVRCGHLWKVSILAPGADAN